MNPEELYTKKEIFLVVIDSRNASEYTNGDYHSSIHIDFNEPIRIDRKSVV